MKLLAIDPSATCTGWAVFTDGACTSSGYISRRKGQEWGGRLAEEIYYVAIGELPVIEVGEGAKTFHPSGIKIVIEDVSNRSNKGKYFGPKLLQWAKAVGICFGSLHSCGSVEGYPSNWLRGKPYAKSKHLRLQFANRYAQHKHPVTNADEATAILFGRWYLDLHVAAPLIGTAAKLTGAQTPSRKINVRTSPASAETPTRLPLVQARRQGRRIGGAKNG